MPGIKIQNGDIAPFVIKQINSDRYVRKSYVYFKLNGRIKN